MGTPITSRTFAGVETGTFFMILLFGLAAGVGGFVWTLEQTKPSELMRTGSVLGPIDPDRGFVNRAQQLYAIGRYRDLADAGEKRRESWPTDLNAWLLPAFALERLGELPGQQGMIDAGEARLLWAGLLEKTQGRTGLVRAPLYYEGWALLGMGHPLEARERFRRFAELTGSGSLSASEYNRACYLAIAGDLDGARSAWSRAARAHTESRQRIVLPWALTDPDLEPIHGSLEFQAWRAFIPLLRADAASGRAGRSASESPETDRERERGSRPPARF